MDPSQNKFKILFILLILAIIATNCRKEIIVPDPELENLFGNWEWIQTSGGIGGITFTPATEGYTIELEFNKNGIYKSFKDGKKTEKRKFYLTEGQSILSSETAYIIEYDKTGLFNCNTHIVNQSVEFAGQDTLYLHDECWDCYGYIYVKK